MDAYWFTWFPGALLATFGVLTLLWKGITSLVRLQQALPVIYEIHHEFSPNSGTSMRDQINGLRSDVRDSNNKTVDLSSSMRKHVADDREAFAAQARTNVRMERQLDRIEDHVRGK
jgi:outer membrane murein-binding lipoprotein Lpp